jgi:hypothetical protein
MNVDVSMAILIGIKNKRTIMDTKNTPPPIPAITERVPVKKPNNINKNIVVRYNSIKKTM